MQGAGSMFCASPVASIDKAVLHCSNAVALGSLFRTSLGVQLQTAVCMDVHEEEQEEEQEERPEEEEYLWKTPLTTSIFFFNLKGNSKIAHG